MSITQKQGSSLPDAQWKQTKENEQTFSAARRRRKGLQLSSE